MVDEWEGRVIDECSPRFPLQAQTEVNVLKVDIECLVETTGRIEVGGADQQARCGETRHLSRIGLQTARSVTVSPDVDVENSLRTEVLEFMDAVRTAEKAVAVARRANLVPEQLDVAVLDSITDDEWRAAWPVPVGTEPAPDRIPEPMPAEVPEPGPVEVPEPSPVETPEPSPEQVIEEEFPAESLPILSDVDAAPNGHPNSVEPQ